MEDEQTKKAVREGYARVATQESSCCGQSSCCGGTSLAETVSKGIGYTDEDLKAVPEGANLGPRLW